MNSLKKVLEKIYKEGKVPEINTEFQRWNVIETLGGISFAMNHDAADGRISLNSANKKFLKISKKVSELLVNSLKEFGVIPPSEYPKSEDGQNLPTAPEGKTYYWDWYKNMKKENDIAVFNGILCSACPFVEEKNPAEINQRQIPCGVFDGMVTGYRRPYECVMIYCGCWTKDEIYRRINDKGGEDALEKFKKKIEDFGNKTFD